MERNYELTGAFEIAVALPRRKENVMTILQEKELEHMNPLPREIDHDHDLVDELSRRLDAVCRYAENIAHAEGDPELQHVWRELEEQEQNNIRKLKEMIVNRIDKGVFLNDL